MQRHTIFHMNSFQETGRPNADVPLSCYFSKAKPHFILSSRREHLLQPLSQSLPLISSRIASLSSSAALSQTPNPEGIPLDTTGHSDEGSWQLNHRSQPLSLLFQIQFPDLISSFEAEHLPLPNPHLQWITQILHSKLPLSHHCFVSDPNFCWHSLSTHRPFWSGKQVD